MTTMEDTKTEASAAFIERLRATMARLGMNQTQLGEYLGVPQTTVNNWFTGGRQPNKSVIRLLDVLATIETLAPNIHANLMPEPRRAGTAEGRAE